MKRCCLRTLYFAMIDASGSRDYVRYQPHSELLSGASPSPRSWRADSITRFGKVAAAPVDRIRQTCRVNQVVAVNT